ncbi:hypothetical protein L7F22_022968 [Adiantum nelumboides]|nr:hypothetical protein [Adiantum nelumboides]
MHTALLSLSPFKVVKELEHHHKNILVKAMAVDLTSTGSIVKFTEAVQKLLETYRGSLSLQLLINNGGILSTTERITPEGYESLIATNYLGHYFLTQSLLPLLQRSKATARIVNVGSFTHYCGKNLCSLLLKMFLRSCLARTCSHLCYNSSKFRWTLFPSSEERDEEKKGFIKSPSLPDGPCL